MMRTFFAKYTSTQYLLFIIMMVAGVLRFYNWFQLPYMHDELSAIIRLDFPHLSDLISNGVVCDTHPPGLQIFLYYWSKLFSTQAYIMKLPFLLMGIASIYMIYWLGKNWFSESCGLLSAAFLASIQYSIFYSEIIRMYASGLFLCLLLLVFWTNIIIPKTENIAKWKYVGYAIFLAACAYNHHFSALFAAIVFIFGIIYSNRQQWLWHAITALIAFIIYLPNIPIFFSQLAQGGNGDWMPAPAYSFIIDFTHYIFQFSVSAEILFLGIIIASLLLYYHNNSINRQKLKIRIFAFSLFGITYLLAFVYSIKINPVLQYSGLLFSFPMLVLLAFSFSDVFNKITLIILCCLLMSLNIFVLINERNHYEVMQRQPMYQSTKFLHQHPKYGKDALIIFSENYKYYKWYENYWGDDYSFISSKMNPLSYQQFDSLLQQSKAQYIVAGNIPMDQMLLARQYFPYEEEKVYGFTNCLYVLSRKAYSDNKSVSLINIGNYQFSAASEEILYITQLRMTSKDYHSRYDYSFETNNDSVALSNTSILIEAKLNNNIIYHNDCPLRNYIKNNGEAKVKICLSERFEHIIKYNQMNKDLTIKVSIIEPSTIKIQRENETFKIVADNKLVYSLYFPI